jgi:hypothetical protein
LPDAQRARRDTIVAFCHAQRPCASVIGRRVDAIKPERPLTSDAAVIEPLAYWSRRSCLNCAWSLPASRASMTKSLIAVGSYPTPLSSRICRVRALSFPLDC